MGINASRRDVWGGIRMVDLADMNAAVPPDVAARREAIRDGSFRPLQGPVTGQSGKVRIPVGSTIRDDDLLKIHYYVTGVQGKPPK